ncbi:hypothetical protein BDZ89DRAFT_961443 [Hymenopellis radicata]|nr:hypothetical protein BDZ89DRAFT_961443 [Hymenopellis radicata]
MNYVFWASILGEGVADIMVSYDIGCQWQVKLQQRRSGMPALLKEDIVDGSPEGTKVHVGTPVWHGAVYEQDCMMSNSLRYKTGAGMTNSEGMERVWAALNPTATATKEMHANGRHENLEDAADNHNFQKNLALGKSFIPRLLWYLL